MKIPGLQEGFYFPASITEWWKYVFPFLRASPRTSSTSFDCRGNSCNYRVVPYRAPPEKPKIFDGPIHEVGSGLKSSCQCRHLRLMTHCPWDVLTDLANSHLVAVLLGQNSLCMTQNVEYHTGPKDGTSLTWPWAMGLSYVSPSARLFSCLKTHS